MQQTEGHMRIESMGSSHERLFRALPEEFYAEHLCEQVLTRIFRERTRLRRVRLVLSSLSGIGSVGFVVWTGVLFEKAASVSGFSEYASLLLSDGSTVGAHGATFALLLLESLPIVPTLLTLVAAAALLTSMRFLYASLLPMRKARIQAPVLAPQP